MSVHSITLETIERTPTEAVATPEAKRFRFKMVVTLNPPSPPGYVSNKDSMGGFGQIFPVGATPFPPLDLIYLTSYLAEKRVPVEPLECLGLGLARQQVVQRVASLAEPDQPDPHRLLLVVRTSAPTLDWDLSVCDAIKTRVPSAQIAIYGSVVPHVVKRIQQEAAIDFIIKGEPDEIVYELMTGYPDDKIFGLIARQGERWHENPDRTPLKDLDQLPFPKWELFPYHHYKLPKSSARSDVPFLPMLTSRGCPVGCHYCPYPIGQGLVWRLRSPKNVVDEIEHLIRDLGVEYILFRDPIFSLNQNRAIQICEEIVRRGLRFEWKCETRVDCLREETLRAMAKAGCTGINFGVESAEVEIQANVGRKPITREQFIKTIRLCHAVGIKTFGFFIIGLPGDTVGTILNSVKFAIDMNTDWVQFTAASPFIGTKLRDWAVSLGLATEDEYAYINSHQAIMGNENLTKDQVRVLHRFAQVIGMYLINRKGILKDSGRRDPVYRLAKRLADGVTQFVAHAVFAVGEWYFRGRFGPAPQPLPKKA